MPTDLKEKDVLEVEIIYTTEDGKGISSGENNELIIVQGVTQEDIGIKAEVIKVYEETVVCKKIGSSDKVVEREVKTGVQSPYALDGEDESDNEDSDEDLEEA